MFIHHLIQPQIAFLIFLYAISNSPAADPDPSIPIFKNDVEHQIQVALDSLTEFDFKDLPLDECVDYLKDYHGINIQFDTNTLEDIGIDRDSPVSMKLKGMTLDSALKLMLAELDPIVTHTIQDEVLVITTTKAKGESPAVRVYNVSRLLKKNETDAERISAVVAKSFSHKLLRVVGPKRSDETPDTETWPKHVVTVFEKMLVVRAPESSQREVRELLKSLDVAKNGPTIEQRMERAGRATEARLRKQIRHLQTENQKLKKDLRRKDRKKEEPDPFSDGEGFGDPFN